MKKMNLNEMKKLTRTEMRKIMAGSGCPARCSSGGCDYPACKCDNNGSDVCDNHS